MIYKTYADIYKEFWNKMGWTEKQKNELVRNYRPAVRPYIDFIHNSDGTNIYIDNAIVVWLKDGSIMIYVGKDE